MKGPDSPIRMTIMSSPAGLPVVRAAVEKVCELMAFDAQSAAAVVLSVDEGLTNIIRHAYGGARDKPIDIELSPMADGALKISLRDYGRWVDPSRIKSRDLSDIRPGGLGVHIIHKCMDSVEYSPAEGQGTVLTLVKMPSSKREQKNK